MSDSLRPQGLQHARLLCPSPTPGACSNSCPSIKSVMSSNHLILCHPLFLLPSIFPSIRVFSNESVLRIAKVLKIQLQHQSFQRLFRTDFLYDGLVGSPCSPRDSPRIFSTTTVWKHQFFSAHFLYSLTLTSIHDYWRNHSFDWMDLSAKY